MAGRPVKKKINLAFQTFSLLLNHLWKAIGTQCCRYLWDHTDIPGYLYNALYLEYLIRSIWSDFAQNNFCSWVDVEFVTTAACESQSALPAEQFLVTSFIFKSGLLFLVVGHLNKLLPSPLLSPCVSEGGSRWAAVGSRFWLPLWRTRRGMGDGGVAAHLSSDAAIWTRGYFRAVFLLVSTELPLPFPISCRCRLGPGQQHWAPAAFPCSA